MHKVFVRMSLAWILGLLVGTPLWAAPGEDAGPMGMGVGLAAGYAMPSNSLYGGGLSGGLVISLGLMKNLAVEISAGYFGSNVEGSEDGLSKGKLTVIPIQLSLQGRFPLSGGRLMPFVELGGGYFLNSFTVDSELAGDWDRVGFTLEEKVEGSVGFHFGAGLDYFLSRNFSLGFGLKYCLAKMKGSWSLTDIAGGTEVGGDLKDLDLSPLMIGIRLRYIFK